MFLRVSNEQTGDELSYGAITAGAEAGDTGVANGGLLIEFADAVLDRDDARLAAARDAVAQTLGPEALVDASGVIGAFDGIDRVADATGIPLEEAKAQITADIRAEIGIDAFAEQRAALEA